MADKPDSHEICFVPGGDHAEFLHQHGIRRSEGEIRDVEGRVVGRHEGVHRFTVGQRKGLGLSSPIPLYVVGIDAGSNAVTVGPRAALDKRELRASGVNWIAGTAPAVGTRVTAQIRHRHHPAAATVQTIDDDRAALIFDGPQIAITPRQAVVFYDDDVVVGGGWID